MEFSKINTPRGNKTFWGPPTPSLRSLLNAVRAKYEGSYYWIILLTNLSKLINYTEFEENLFEVTIYRAQIKRIKICSSDQDPGPCILTVIFIGKLFFFVKFCKLFYYNPLSLVAHKIKVDSKNIFSIYCF